MLHAQHTVIRVLWHGPGLSLCESDVNEAQWHLDNL